MEVVVAFSLVMMGILGVSSLVIQNIRAENINRDYLIASMLAQEGLELARNIRDNNWLDDTADWHSYIYSAGGDNTFTLVAEPGPLSSILDHSAESITDPESRLSFDGYYNHSSGQQTRFHRLITVRAYPAADPNPQYLEIECHIQWQARGVTHNYRAFSQLAPWR
jgi:Tfp pilus assembly protein PilV